MKKQLFILGMLWVICSDILAQINPSPSQYFYSKMFQNVAATSLDTGVRIDASYRSMLPNSFVGSPVNTMFSLQTSTSQHSGLGVQFQGERAGLIARNRVMGSYAVDLSKGKTRFRLGVGLGALMSRIVSGTAVPILGDANDPMIAAFNKGKTRIDGSVGLLLESNDWEIMTTVPSLGSIQEFKDYDGIDYSVMNSMISKKFKLSGDGDTYLKPMVGHRLLQGTEDVFDIGSMMSYRNMLNFMLLYHTNNELAMGVGIPLKNKLMLNFTYNTGRVYSKDYLNVGGSIEAHFMYRF
jgi:type IX secretion system PorP/SprF family membrane protein